MRRSPPAPAPPPANSVPPKTPSRTDSLAVPPSYRAKTPPPTTSTAASSSTNTNPPRPTESHLTQELADTAWRLKRIPQLEAELLSQAPSPLTLIPQLATLGLHSQRLSRQFQKILDHLREIQSERRHEEQRQLKQAAALLELHKHKGLPYNPAEHGFVFSKDQVESFAQRLMRLNESRHIEHVLFHMPPARAASASF
jgi:hypothetical protein